MRLWRTARLCAGLPERQPELRASAQRACRAVSYTHLDVYKRQEVVFVASPDIDLGHPGPYRVAELLDKPFLLTERNANYRRTFCLLYTSRCV